MIIEQIVTNLENMEKEEIENAILKKFTLKVLI